MPRCSRSSRPLGRLFCQLLAVSVVAVMFVASEEASGMLTVVSSRRVRPHSSFQVAVSVQGGKEDTTVDLELVNSGDDGTNRTYSQRVTVSPDSTRTVQLQVADLGPGKVELKAHARGGVQYQNSTDLEYSGKSASILIQTDKAQYKPGQTVLLRVFVLDAQLRPTIDQPLQIYVTDGSKNRVKQWWGAAASGGVWSGRLPMSERPVLGLWTITVELPGENKAEAQFTVAEYVLPTFEVTASVPRHLSFQDGELVVTVNAKYTYGKPVVGTVSVRANLPYVYSPPPYPEGPVVHMVPLMVAEDAAVPVPATAEVPASPVTSTATPATSTATPATSPATPATSTTTPEPQPTHVEKVVPIDGTADVVFNMKRDLRLLDDMWGHYMNLEISVTETLTGKKQNATADAQISKRAFDMEFVNSHLEFVPNTTYTVQVQLKKLDGSPLLNPGGEMKLGYGPWNDLTYMTESVPPSGLVKFEIEIPDTNSTFISLQAEYKNETAYSSVSRRSPEESNKDLEVEVLTAKPKVGDEVEVRVTSKKLPQSLSYAVLGPLDLVLSDSLKPAQPATTLRFTVTEAMAPIARVLVHGVSSTGELVAANKDLELSIPDTVSVSVQPGRVEPGKDVHLQVQAPPQSSLALLGVDQKVLLLDSSNTLTKERVRSERLSHDPSESTRHWGRWSTLAVDTFEDAGSAFITNAKVQRRQLYFMKGGVGGAFGGAGPLAAAALDISTPAAPQFAVASAESLARPGTGMAAPPRLRSNFPETWLWEDLNSGVDGNVSLKRTIPDTITSWVVTALAIDPVRGLSVSNPSNVTVFRPFFVTLNLPYSVIRGETVAVPVLVFNYMNSDMTAVVTLENEKGEFDFASSSTGGRVERQAKEAGQRREVTVRGQNAATVTFDITPKKVGHVTLKVTAVGDTAGDAVERKLRVKAEGETQHRNKVVPIDLQKETTFNATVPVEIPDNAVPDSQNLEVSAVGDILGPSASNLDGLLRMPFGCGEQNMLSFVPNIVIMEYLKRTRRSSPEVEKKARTYSEVGYQRELTYRHKDGSFSAFGESDRNGSTWLTAFVAKSFRQAEPYVDVEREVVEKALDWLAKNQAANGSFPEVGTVSHRDMQGGAAGGLALTAYVLITFLDTKDSTFKHQDTVKKTLDYLVTNLKGLDDPYAIAISAYALELAGHPAKETAFKLLEEKATSNGGHRWWKKTVEGDANNPFAGFAGHNSVDVEMTSYALLTYLRRGLLDQALPIMQWLIAQRNSNGGFASTQDTVVGLQALARLAESISLKPGSVRIRYSHKLGENSFAVNSKNDLILQKHELPREVREVKVAADGSGFALLQVSWSYNEVGAGKHPLFKLRVTPDNTTGSGQLLLDVCTSFVAGPYGSESNMAVVEVGMPSGFTADPEALQELKKDVNVKLIETKEQDTVIVLYFDKIDVKDTCVKVAGVRSHFVTKQKPVPVTVYDYYDQSRRARVFYQPSSVDVEDKL